MSAFRDEGVGGRRGVGGERTRRRRPPPRPVEVVSVSTLKPRLVSVRMSGPGLEVFQDAAPTSHIKVYLPRLAQAEPLLPEIGPGGAVWPADERCQYSAFCSAGSRAPHPERTLSPTFPNRTGAVAGRRRFRDAQEHHRCRFRQRET
jgi:hypothetical protein